MKRIGLLIDEISRLKRISAKEIVNNKAAECVYYRYIVTWVSVRVYGIASARVSSALGSISTRMVYHGCTTIDKKIKEFNAETLELLTDLLFADDKAIKRKKSEVYSAYELYNMLKKYFISDYLFTQMSKPKKENKADLSELGKNQSRSYYYNSDFEWIKREIRKNDYLKEKWEINLYASALREACAWGRRIDMENRIRMEQLKKSQDNGVYSSIID